MKKGLQELATAYEDVINKIAEGESFRKEEQSNCELWVQSVCGLKLELDQLITTAKDVKRKHAAYIESQLVKSPEKATVV